MRAKTPHRTSNSLPAPTPRARPGAPCVGLVFLLAVLFQTAPGVAQLGDDELWYDGPLNVQPGGNPVESDVDVDGLVRTVVVWESNLNSTDIQARRFDRHGNPVEDPIPVNDPVVPRQVDPAVAAAHDGSFLVVWVHEDPDTDVFTIRSRHFDTNGSPTGPERVVNEAGLVPSFPGGNHRPDVAALAGGGFVAVWRSATTGGSDTNDSIQARLIDTGGVPSGSQFQVNTTISSSQNYPTVAALPLDGLGDTYDGGFVVGWTRPDLHVRRFRANGTSSENDTPIDGTNDGTSLRLDVNSWARQIGATWYEAGEIRARLFGIDLTPAGATQVVNAVADTDGNEPAIAEIGPDGYYLLWETDTSVGNDSDGSSIQGRILGPQGGFAGDQFQVNTFIAGNQEKVAAGSRLGRLALSWRSAGNSVETNTTSIIGYLLDYCLFCDDFERDDTSRWSQTIP